MRNLILLFVACLSWGVVDPVVAQDKPWSRERAWNWYNNMPWLCGVNYIPAYAINYTAMWDKTTFSAKDIDRELQLLEDLRMNCVRVVLQHAVY